MKQNKVELSEEQHEQVKKHAKKTKRTIKGVVALAIELYFETSVDRFKRVKQENDNKLLED